jgi:predicted CXXCH cytochrome family protein
MKRGGLIVIGAIPLLLALGFVVTDKVVYSFEKRDTFCIACHLHEKKFKEFTAPTNEQVSLAAKHHAPKGVRCIDCHKGEGILERMEVLGVAGADTLIYLIGLHEEPKRVKFPLGNATCLKCHQDSLVPKGSYSTAYHSLTPHANLPLRCAECHAAHPAGNPKQRFLVEERVIPICKRCHTAMFD